MTFERLQYKVAQLTGHEPERMEPDQDLKFVGIAGKFVDGTKFTHRAKSWQALWNITELAARNLHPDRRKETGTYWARRPFDHLNCKPRAGEAIKERRKYQGKRRGEDRRVRHFEHTPYLYSRRNHRRSGKDRRGQSYSFWNRPDAFNQPKKCAAVGGRRSGKLDRRVTQLYPHKQRRIFFDDRRKNPEQRIKTGLAWHRKDVEVPLKPGTALRIRKDDLYGDLYRRIKPGTYWNRAGELTRAMGINVSMLLPARKGENPFRDKYPATLDPMIQRLKAYRGICNESVKGIIKESVLGVIEGSMSHRNYDKAIKKQLDRVEEALKEMDRITGLLPTPGIFADEMLKRADEYCKKWEEWLESASLAPYPASEPERICVDCEHYFRGPATSMPRCVNRSDAFSLITSEPLIMVAEWERQNGGYQKGKPDSAASPYIQCGLTGRHWTPKTPEPEPEPIIPKPFMALYKAAGKLGSTYKLWKEWNECRKCLGNLKNNPPEPTPEPVVLDPFMKLYWAAGQLPGGAFYPEYRNCYNYLEKNKLPGVLKPKTP